MRRSQRPRSMAPIPRSSRAGISATRTTRGPNAPGPKNVNVPQHTRRFRFVLDTARFDTAMETLVVVLWPGDRGPAEVDAARDTIRAIEKADGTLQIADLELGNLVPGEKAWIERARFMLRLCRSPFGAG